MTEPVLGAGDPVAALLEWLSLDPALVEGLGGSQWLFGSELPLDVAEAMPRPAVIVAASGGFTEDLPEVIDRVRVDTRSYGRSPDEAQRIAVLVRLRMRALGRFTSTLGTVLHAPVRNGGYIPLREQVGGWPLVLRSYLVPYDELAAA